ncbi:MAG TPA: alpha/beta fold hydrolase [Verrucomicrobiae bacterium]|nr:alpha/beta fold hydrolase [Verrucomicrobiae bacterium]
MPLVPSSYRAPWFLRNPHLHTVYPVFCRRVPEVLYQRERLELEDGDFLDLDWARVKGRSPVRAVVVAHGLEGSSSGPYVRGMVRAFNRRGWDALALNFRGCSGEPNRLLRSYHSGVTDDLWRVTQYVQAKGYQAVALVGFSLGGNVVLKLLGDLGEQAPSWLEGAVGVSVPCDLKASARSMARAINRPYMKRFLINLRAKIRAKQHRFPVELDDSGYGQLKTFRHFDDRYTAPLHGFRDAEDYWAQCSSRFFFETIRRPALLLNAVDDPFLAPECFPLELARDHAWLHLEMPVQGGHVGFVGSGLRRDEYYSERQALLFLRAETDTRADGPRRSAAGKTV